MGIKAIMMFITSLLIMYRGNRWLWYSSGSPTSGRSVDTIRVIFVGIARIVQARIMRVRDRMVRIMDGGIAGFVRDRIARIMCGEIVRIVCVRIARVVYMTSLVMLKASSLPTSWFMHC